MRLVRASRAAHVLAVAGAGMTVLTSPATAAETSSDELPVEGTFSYHSGHSDSRDEIRGAVHAVRRIPGGTAVYYSVGSPEGAGWTPELAMPFVGLGDDYAAGDAWAVGLVDVEGLAYYQPMVGPDGCLCLSVSELGRDSGVLHVGWAVLPPLPPELTSVGVSFGFGNQVEAVPVEDGPLEPAVEQPSTVLGAGWPALPDAAAVAAVPDPSRYVRSLVRNVADLQGTVTTQERPGRVDESLSADVLFAVDSAALTPAAQQTLSELADRLRERAVGEVVVAGHTDSTGQDDYNLRLSQARAQSVLDVLRARGGPAVQLTARGLGEQQPIADNGNPEGRAQNRRVTVTYSVGGS
jgi:outer membrane protein OmpA-like peptidoglycan-associated protein